METNAVQARNLLKLAKQEINRVYGWSAKEYSARISETKNGLKLNIKLLAPKKGFKTISDFLIDKVGVKYKHLDVMHKPISMHIESIIEEEIKKGVECGSISNMSWEVYSTEGNRKTQNATIRFINNLYEYSV